MQSNVNSSIGQYLETLEDTTLYTKKSRIQCLECIKSQLETDGCGATRSEVLRMLTVFINCLKDDIQCLPQAISTISSLLTNVKIILKLEIQDLIPSALALLHMLKTLCVSNEAAKLREMCLELFIKYPVDVISTVVTYNSPQILKIFEEYRPDHTNVKKEVIVFLQKLLQLLPAESKNLFVKEGLEVCFDDIIPSVLYVILETDFTHKVLFVECLETLTDALVPVDYFQCKQWKNGILDSICDSNKYTFVMKEQLQSGSDIWHRLWIVFVKLLKNSITNAHTNKNKITVTPINLMLPVVELAFKMDIINRCRAFQCWDNLIDNFSKETNERCLPKRIKLVMIPLKLNNAKTEETALAKFNTWWHLIRKFENKMDMFANDILFTFICFAFGKPSSDKKPALVGVGEQYNNVSLLCLQAFVQIVGHDDDCDCCSNFPKLIGKVMTAKMLVNYWDGWMFALKEGIKLGYKIYNENINESTNATPKPILCVWKAFFCTIAELPPNGVRRDLIDGLIQVLLDLAQSCLNYDHFSDVIFSLTICLFENDEKTKLVLTSAKGEGLPLEKVFSVITYPGVLDVCKRFETEIAVEKLKPLTNLTVAAKLVNLLLNNLTPHDSSLKLWTALVHSTKESKTDISPKTLCKLLAWPLKSVHQMSEDKYAAMAWSTMYNLIYDVKNIICKTGLENDILDCIRQPHTNESKFFKLCLTISLLKSKVVKKEDTGNLPELLTNLIPEMGDYTEFKEAIPILIDTIVVMLNNVVVSENVQSNKIPLHCVNHVIRIIIKGIRSHSDEVNPIDANILIILKNLFNAVRPLCKVPVYSDNICDFVDQLREQGLKINKNSLLFKFIDTELKTFLPISIDSVKNKITDSIEMFNRKTIEDVNKNAKEFPLPDVNKVVKKVKKKEASIVNTVIDNGEEYVVVKSHWKFNPRKLTEKQKEKFQRKREDIPALYQDLSQSQEEFKLVTWKTDSQDTSSNSKSSKSTIIEDAPSILKNMQSTEVVPNIMESMKLKNDKNHSMQQPNIKDTGCNIKDDTPKKVNRVSLSTPKTIRSPRMALKDRVFQNVKNLIEKSTPHNVITEKNTGDHTENVLSTTQTNTNKIVNLNNSPLALLSADRPSRMKRKPKKFDDVELFGLKKRPISQNDARSESPIDDSIIVSHESSNTNLNNTEKANESIEPILKGKDTVGESDKEVVCTVESASNAEHTGSNQKVLKSDTFVAMQSDATKNILNEPAAEDVTLVNNKDEALKTKINNDAQDDLKNDDVQDSLKDDSIQDYKKQEMQMLCDSRDSQKIANKEIINDENTTVEISTETEHNKNKAEDFKTPTKKTKEVSQKSNTKKSATKRSRIEKELAIDTVEGHPYLNIQSEKRSTRKKAINNENNRRKTLSDKIGKEHPETKISPKRNKKLKGDNKLTIHSQDSTSVVVEERNTKVKDVNNLTLVSQDSTLVVGEATNKSVKEADKLTLHCQDSPSVTVEETQERNTPEKCTIISNEEAPCSEDVIESSQDSTFTTLSSKSATRTPRRLPVIAIKRINILPKTKDTDTQDLLQESDCKNLNSVSDNYVNQENKEDDIELPQNKTAEVEKNQSELTENMDTEPIPDASMTDDVIIIDDDELPITISTDNNVGLETQELTEAETQPNDPAEFRKLESTNNVAPKSIESLNTPMETEENISFTDNTSLSAPRLQEDKIASEPHETLDVCSQKDTDVSSPFKDDSERKKDFMNNTLEISPIKVQSPDRDKPSPTKETSSDYMVIKLTSPVQSNGEPFDKSDSPEFFTSEKVSPDKRDLSPPRVEISVNSGSPSSSLSLKKNRPQALRPSGRAAHMLGLCVPESLNTIRNPERVEPEELKKVSTSTPARRNLRVLYNVDNGDSPGENDQQEQFLRFKKDLPLTDSSPSVPILKRKLIDIVDETTASPASKKKRVSFHDPPVSTTVSVQKYIEPGCIKSPSSAHKRSDRPMLRTYSKSPKRLENTFVKLDTVLSKAVESFTDEQPDSLNNDTASLDVTPAVEVVNTSELNDTDPICPDLVDCKDSIENIAAQLSSLAMKDLFIKELEGTVATIGDLAKMSELDVNRLCIKAPKIQIAKKALTDYAKKHAVAAPPDIPEPGILIDDTALAVEMTESVPKTACVQTQTTTACLSDAQIQTRTEIFKLASTQTNIETLEASVQTIESGSKSTSEIISTCLTERGDFVDRLAEQLEEASKRRISECLPTKTVIDILANKSDDSTLQLVLSKIFDSLNQNVTSDERKCKELSFLKDYLSDRFDGRELILFCSQLLQNVYDKPA